MNNELLNPTSLIDIEQLSYFKTKLLNVTKSQTSITKTTESLDPHVAAEYKLVNTSGDQLGETITVYKDQFLKDAKFYATKEEAEEAGLTPPTGLEFPAIYLVFNITGEEGKSPIWISVKHLVNVYTAGSGIDITNNAIAIKLAQLSGLALEGGELKASVDNSTITINNSSKKLLVGSSAQLSNGQLATASSSVKGAVKIGTGLTIDSDGVLSAPTITVDDSLSTTSTNPVQNKVITSNINSIGSEISTINGNIEQLLDGKVDKEDGKGLSTNDYTTDEKTKLAGIASGATKVTSSGDDSGYTLSIASASGSTSTVGDTAHPVKYAVIAFSADEAATAVSATYDGENNNIANTYVKLSDSRNVALTGSFSVNAGSTGTVSLAGSAVSVSGDATFNDSVYIPDTSLIVSTESGNKSLSDVYVKKDGNKVLSDNNYTTAEKNKLAGITESATKTSMSSSADGGYTLSITSGSSTQTLGASSTPIAHSVEATNAQNASYATNAGSATKATQDGSGQNIVSTYAKKTEVVRATQADIDSIFE